MTRERLADIKANSTIEILHIRDIITRDELRELLRLAERGMYAESVMDDLIDVGSLLAGVAGIGVVRIDRIQPIIDAWFVALEAYHKWKEKI